MSASFEHEVLVEIVREHPEVVLALLGSAHDASDEIEVLTAPESLGTLRSEKSIDAASCSAIAGTPSIDTGSRSTE